MICAFGIRDLWEGAVAKRDRVKKDMLLDSFYCVARIVDEISFFFFFISLEYSSRCGRKERALFSSADFVILCSVMKTHGWFRIPRPALSIPLMMKKVTPFHVTCIFILLKKYLRSSLQAVVGWILWIWKMMLFQFVLGAFCLVEGLRLANLVRQLDLIVCLFVRVRGVIYEAELSR